MVNIKIFPIVFKGILGPIDKEILAYKINVFGNLKLDHFKAKR